MLLAGIDKLDKEALNILPPFTFGQTVKEILEYLDVNGESSVSQITKNVGKEQVIVSQSLKKLREANLVKTKRHGIFIYYAINEEYPASIFVCLRKLFGYMTDNFYFLGKTN